MAVKARRDRLCGYGGPRDFAEQGILETWRLRRGIMRLLTSQEIALALAEAEQERPHGMGEET